MERKWGKLPQEHDAEQDPGVAVQLARGDGPTRQRRNRPGKRAQGRVPGGFVLEGGVDGQITDGGKDGDEPGQSVGRQKTEHDAEQGESPSEDLGRHRPDPARRERTVSGPDHQRVLMPLKKMIQRKNAGSQRPDTEQDHGEPPPRPVRSGGNGIRRQRDNQQKCGDPRFSQLKIGVKFLSKTHGDSSPR